MSPVDKQFVIDVADSIRIDYTIDDSEEFITFNTVFRKITISLKPIILHNKAFMRSKLPREDFVNKAADYIRECFKESGDKV